MLEPGESTRVIVAVSFIRPNIWMVVGVAKKMDLESRLRQTANIRPKVTGVIFLN